MKLFLTAGDVVTIVLPSGKEISIEVTQDTASVTQGDFVLFDEVLSHKTWEQTSPEALVKYLKEHGHS
jgi:hypothetical protein